MKRCSIFLYIFALFFYAQVVFAADIFLGADKSSISVNDTVVVTAYINSSGIAINSAEGVISFPTDLFSVESVSMAGSIFSIWVEQPYFSNTAGTVSFNGGSPNPGFNGTRGSAVKIYLKAKNKGTATLGVVSGNVYANDGLGTDVTSSKKGVTLTIGEQINKIPVVVSNTPSAPVVVSADMPDQERWYKKNTSTFTWNIDSTITTTQLLVDTSANSTPTITYAPAIGRKDVSGFPEGVSYIHVRLANANGWGVTTHRKVKIDTVPPTELTVIPENTSDDYIKLSLSAKDKTSGVQSYKILYNDNLLGGTSVNPSSANTTDIVLPAIPAGTQELVVYVYDRANNAQMRAITVESPKIKAPTITTYPEVVTKGEQIEVIGTSYPLGNVLVFIKHGDNQEKSYLVKSDESGVFTFKSEDVTKTGLTALWAVATRGDAIQSDPSAPVYVQVNKSLIVRTGLFATEVLIVLIPLILLLILLACLMYYGFHTFRMMRRRLLLDLNKTEDESKKIFDVLKKDINTTTKYTTNDKEKEGLHTLTKDVDQAEEYFEKRIEKIKKEDL